MVAAMVPSPDPGPAYRPSLRDIAKALGLSHVAVSLALRDSPRVSEARRAEVKAMADKLGYRPDPMLASLVAYRQSKRPAGIRACLGWINQWPRPEELREHKEFDKYWLGARDAAERSEQTAVIRGAGWSSQTRTRLAGAVGRKPGRFVHFEPISRLRAYFP